MAAATEDRVILSATIDAVRPAVAIDRIGPLAADERVIARAGEGQRLGDIARVNSHPLAGGRIAQCPVVFGEG